MRNRVSLTISLLLLSGMLWATGPVLRLESPGKQLHAILYSDNGKLFYSVKAGSLKLIAPSLLGIKFDDRTIGNDVQQISLLHKKTFFETRPSRLNSNRAINHYIEYAILVKGNAITDTISFRLFDNGCAFRYKAAGTDHGKILEEFTSFTLPAASRIWYFERNNNWKLKSYAGLWLSTTPEQLPSVSSQGPVQGKPLVLELPGKKYMVISEALLKTYSGMRLKATGNNTVQVNFTEGEAGFAVHGKIQSPWRVILFGNSLNELVNNKVIENLNPSPDPALFRDQRWIKPGVAVWSWITRKENYMEPEEEKKFVDAAASLNFQYSMIDEGWETKWNDKWKELKSLCDYAASKKIGIWVWKHSKEILDTTQRNLFLDSIRHCGAVGLKTDFMNSEEKGFIDFETGLLMAAAKRKLMVNFHGCQAPSGESVSFPNEMTREGIRGLELNIMNEPIPAWHNAALPFTRLILGHGDYTPAFFTNKANTTYTHQLALLYLFNSPFQCLAENPVTLLSDPIYKPILPLLRSLPVTWDQTIVLPGSEIGKLAAFARRKGKDWYIVVINGMESATVFELDPNFLSNKGFVRSMLIRDTAGDKGFLQEAIQLRAGVKSKFSIPANGGILIRIKN